MMTPTFWAFASMVTERPTPHQVWPVAIVFRTRLGRNTGARVSGHQQENSARGEGGGRGGHAGGGGAGAAHERRLLRVTADEPSTS